MALRKIFKLFFIKKVHCKLEVCYNEYINKLIETQRSIVLALQRWDNIERLKAYRSPSNRRYYTDEHLTSIIHAFSCRLYGLRKYKSKIKTDKEVISLGIN